MDGRSGPKRQPYSVRVVRELCGSLVERGGRSGERRGLCWWLLLWLLLLLLWLLLLAALADCLRVYGWIVAHVRPAGLEVWRNVTALAYSGLVCASGRKGQ